MRDFHSINVYVSEPTKVKMSADNDDEKNKNDRVVYCSSTFNKQHAFKVAPPLPSFASMMFPEELTEALKTKLDINEPTSFQIQAIPLLLEERDLIAKASPGYGKTLSLCIAAVLRAI